MRKMIWVFWPSFIVAGLGTILLFTLLDPVDLRFVGPLELERSAGSSAFTCWLQRRADEVNRCPLVPVERPLGCPKREDPNAAC